MSVAKDIAQILHEATIGELGVDLFISQMPESPDEALAVYETGGSEYDAVSALATASVLIKSRAADYESAYMLIADAAGYLSAIGDENYYLSGMNAGVVLNEDTDDEVIYLRVVPTSEPYPVGRDSSERVEFAQSFTLTICR